VKKPFHQCVRRGFPPAGFLPVNAVSAFSVLYEHIAGFGALGQTAARQLDETAVRAFKHRRVALEPFEHVSIQETSPPSISFDFSLRGAGAAVLDRFYLTTARRRLIGLEGDDNADRGLFVPAPASGLTAGILCRQP